MLGMWDFLELFLNRASHSDSMCYTIGNLQLNERMIEYGAAVA
jgi:hypothetical protein